LLLAYKTLLVFTTDLIPKYQFVTGLVGMLSSLVMISYLHYFMPFYNLVVNLLYLVLFSWNFSSYLSGFVVEFFSGYSSFIREFFICIVVVAPIFIVFFTITFLVRREFFKLYLYDISSHDERKDGKYIFQEDSTLVDVLVHMTNDPVLQRKIYETRLKNGYTLRTKIFYSLFLIYESELNDVDRLKLNQMTMRSFISSFIFVDTFYLFDYCTLKKSEINFSSENAVDTMLELNRIHKYQGKMSKWFTNLWKRYLVHIVNFDVFPSVVSTLNHYEKLIDQSYFKLLREDGKNPIVLRNYSSYLAKTKKDFEQSHVYKKLADKEEEALRKANRDTDNLPKQEGNISPIQVEIERENSLGSKTLSDKKSERRASEVSFGNTSFGTSINGDEKERYQSYLERISSHRPLPPIALFLFVSLLCLFGAAFISLSYANTKILSVKYGLITKEIKAAGSISKLFLSTSLNLRYLQLSYIPGQNYNGTYYTLKINEDIANLESMATSLYDSTIQELYVQDIWKNSQLVGIFNSQSQKLTMMTLFDATMVFVSEVKASVLFLNTNKDGKLVQNLADFKNVNLNSRFPIINGYEALKTGFLNAQAYYKYQFIIFSCLIGIFAFLPFIGYVLVYFYIRYEQLKIFKLITNVPKSAISNVYKTYATIKNEEQDLNDQDDDRENLILASLTSDGNGTDGQLPVLKQFTLKFIIFFLIFLTFTVSLIVIGVVLEVELKEDSQFMSIAEKRSYLIDRVHFNTLEKALYSSIPNTPLNITSVSELQSYLVSDRKNLQVTNDILRVGSTELDMKGSDGNGHLDLEILNYERPCADATRYECISLSELFLEFFGATDHLIATTFFDTSNTFFQTIKLLDHGLLSEKQDKFINIYYSTHSNFEITITNVIDIIFAFSLVATVGAAIILFLDLPFKLSQEFFKAKRLFLNFPTKILDSNSVLKEFLQGKNINLEKQKQILIAESNEKFENILTKTDDSVIQFDQKLIIQSLNNAAMSMFDCKEDASKFIGKPFADLFSEKSKELLLKNFHPTEHKMYKKAYSDDLEVMVNNQIVSVHVTITVDKFFIAFIKDISVIKNQESLLEYEKDRAAKLLYDILPVSIAKKKTENKNKIIVDAHKECTILFADICNFTKISSEMSAEDLVQMLNDLFNCFDDACLTHNIEKIKTIGDCYMAASGIPEYKRDHAESMIEFAKNMLECVEEYNKKSGRNIQIRIGVNSGKVVAGVIGKKKYAYDLWGDAVNVASRMESSGLPGKIHVSRSTFTLVHKRYHFKELKEIEIKGKGKMKTYIYQRTIKEAK
jgi:class 3 adenylate cyclase